MDKKILYILPIALILSLAFLASNAEAAGEPAFCAINSGLNISDGVPGPTISGATAWFNWTVTYGSTANSTVLNVTNVTFFRNDTREILCQNVSLRINSTTRGNCTFDSTALVDDDALVIVAEAYLSNGTGGTERCTNLSFMSAVNINNTAPSLTGLADNGKIFYGVGGSATDNITVTVDNATRNCTLLIGSTTGGSQNLRRVITKGPSVQNCTYQPTQTDLPDGSYFVRWSAFDGLDTRVSDRTYNIQLGSNKHVSAPTIEVAAAAAEQKSKMDKWSVAGLLLVGIAAVWIVSQKK